MSNSPYRVLAVGAASGAPALDALEALVAALPAGLDLPVAVAAFREQGGSDALVARLQAATRLAVVEPDDKDDLEAGQVYLAPAGYHLLLDRGMAALACDDEAEMPSVAALF